MIGISDQTWSGARDAIGQQKATAAVMLVFDKHAKGEITSTSKYLNGMTEKARVGDLHLERSVYGRLAKTAA